MDNWLSKVLTDISDKHTVSNEKARLLLKKILAIVFGEKFAKSDVRLLNEENINGNNEVN